MSEKVNLSVSRWSLKTFYQVMISGALVSTGQLTILSICAGFVTNKFFCEVLTKLVFN